MFGIGGAWAAKLLYKSASQRSNQKSVALKWEAGFTDWFIVLNLLRQQLESFLSMFSGSKDGTHLTHIM